MDSFLIFLSLTIFSFSGYLVWPSRYNVLSHGSVAAGFISIIVPALILNIPANYPSEVVSLYIWILVIGVLFFVPGLYLGFYLGLRTTTTFSFDVLDVNDYENKITTLTKALLIAGICGLILSYIGMGFIPAFAENPIGAKLFRGEYQEPYRRVAILFRTSFFLLTTIIPIACIIWYKYRSKFFLFAVGTAVILLAASLQRSGAFSGIVFAFVIIMSFKSRLHFAILMILLVAVFILSAFFYFIIGVRDFSSEKDVWAVIGESSPEILDHLDFVSKFIENPVYTYGRTIYGGLIPGHYEWNPAVYTLIMVNPGQDINDIGSGGLRLPLPMWGYVAFSWIGVITFSLFTGILNGMFLGILKNMFIKYQSIVIRTVALISFGSLFGLLVNFTQLSMYAIPPAIVSLFYLYRFKWKE